MCAVYVGVNYYYTGVLLVKWTPNHNKKGRNRIYIAPTTAAIDTEADDENRDTLVSNDPLLGEDDDVTKEPVKFKSNPMDE